MGTINIRKFGLAWGATFALLYLGCAFVMLTAGEENTILFFNSLLHGLDVRPIIRMDIPLWEVLVGIVEIFIIGWLTGATIAGIYNFGAAPPKTLNRDKEVQ
ncbi:hypothetical protein A7E78_04650 [Syntrophotalea acetylenivorans]|uniref:Uncharacterized protein n=1 Tax=Syntrophotalea acetylenivorans TaxID=1842532 RepID=A0A1L3GMR4_9BACT|nr:DUF5676 family membrane protein [Syntrophotalea acetylenivorans]APG27185.1 hypothetical protein A7E78_04650 [Syntrophotalea acetylenivorans]